MHSFRQRALASGGSSQQLGRLFGWGGTAIYRRQVYLSSIRPRRREAIHRKTLPIRSR
jgi:hypothetical protein